MEKTRNSDNLSALRDVIKGFLEGSIQRNDAEDQYRFFHALLHEQTPGFAAGREPDYLKSLLNYHNRANFSKATALYRFDHPSLHPVSEAGDKKILDLIPDFIPDAVKNGETGKTARTVISKNENLEYRLHAVSFSIDDRKTILAAVSSSLYYSDEKLSFLSQLLQRLYTRASLWCSSIFIDLQHETSMALVRYFDEQKGNRDKTGIIFVFPYINSIFGHLGLRTVKDVADFIMAHLNETVPEAELIVSLDFKTYVCMVPASGRFREGAPIKIDFVYDSITLPYKNKIIPLEDNTLVYHFLDSIYSFESAGENTRD
ncbi:MAG TPA: hypothetical protein PK926_04170 [Spirochaetota bacterium]|nr:hypothetical protein [Spirochaetota bacterium]HPI89166.1 hypothetical protein [Spirochaetota bacterium]HPR46839.1 hypothetical protein [Spirochaetota bacterium]